MTPVRNGEFVCKGFNERDLALANVGRGPMVPPGAIDAIKREVTDKNTGSWLSGALYATACGALIKSYNPAKGAVTCLSCLDADPQPQLEQPK